MNKNEFLQTLKSVGERYVSIFSKNLGSNQKRCLIYNEKGELSVTRDGLSIAKALKWDTGAQKTIHNFIERQIAHKLKDNSTSFFLLMGHILSNYESFETIKRALQRISLGEPDFKAESMHTAICNSIKTNIYPQFIPFVDDLVERLQRIPKEIAQHDYMPHIFYLNLYILPHMSQDKLKLYLDPEKQYFAFKSKADFLKDISELEMDELCTFFDSSKEELEITTVQPGIVEVSAPRIAPVEKRLGLALWYLDAAQACDPVRSKAMRDYYERGASRMAGLNGTLYSTGFYANEYALLGEDAIGVAVETVKGGATVSLAGHCDRAGISILKDIIGQQFNPLYIEGYTAASECIKIVLQVTDYFFNSTFIPQTWSGH